MKNYLKGRPKAKISAVLKESLKRKCEGIRIDGVGGNYFINHPKAVKLEREGPEPVVVLCQNGKAVGSAFHVDVGLHNTNNEPVKGFYMTSLHAVSERCIVVKDDEEKAKYKTEDAIFCTECTTDTFCDDGFNAVIAESCDDCFKDNKCMIVSNGDYYLLIDGEMAFVNVHYLSNSFSTDLCLLEVKNPNLWKNSGTPLELKALSKEDPVDLRIIGYNMLDFETFIKVVCKRAELIDEGTFKLWTVPNELSQSKIAKWELMTKECGCSSIVHNGMVTPGPIMSENSVVGVHIGGRDLMKVYDGDIDEAFENSALDFTNKGVPISDSIIMAIREKAADIWEKEP
eukprot:TRINITY_DN244476_c0_g1_i1.p1 TRINITY_DN244476_c0_g1~~TRINITY_DN244476_c0_g1_i1.p1  ORF type:complete len:386 (+),score=99.62 TRINITY_DN244476_c0_g1_i1:132-1160(+)